MDQSFWFVLSFLVMWVRFDSCALRSSFDVSTASHAFLSLIGAPFDRAFYCDSFDTLGWAWG